MAVAAYFGAFGAFAGAFGPGVVSVVGRLLRRVSAPLDLAVAELRSNAARTRPLLAIVALTIAGSTAILGSVENLEDGVGEIARADFPDRTVWVTSDRPYNELFMARIDPHVLPGLRKLPEVDRVVSYFSTFFDWHGRRVRVFAYGSSTPWNERALIAGDPDRIDRDLSAGRGLLISPDLATLLDISPGDEMKLPIGSRQATRRLSGLVSNFGWPGGTIQLGSADFRAMFGRGLLTGARVEMRSGVPPGEYLNGSIRQIAENYGLKVENADDADRVATSAARAGVSQLREIAVLFLFMAIVAVAGVTMTAVAQRRELLVALHALGISSRQLRQAVTAEMGLVIVVAASLGLLGGVVGQLLILKLLGGLAGYPLSYHLVLLPLLVGIGVASATIVVGSAILAKLAVRGLGTRVIAWE